MEAATERLTMDAFEPGGLVQPLPHARQLAWQELEFYAFVHFGMNTATDREWGLGSEQASQFALRDLDADQWMRAFVDAGMKGVILTAKHHDGFCLWPTRTTDHSVANSPWRQGTGDVVREVAEAAARHGLRLGIYLSPWDRHDASWGSGSDYDDFFVAQLEELLGEYGPVFTVWFDGAMGDGERSQDYDWERYNRVIRRLQPGAVISVCGPDTRWCGNEAGSTRTDEWSVVPGELRSAELTAENSQKVDDGTFTKRVSSDDDLGSRQAVEGSEDDLVWYPAEVNTSIRPGWFHHPAEDGRVRSVEDLFAVYRSSVGGNATFLLGVPPTLDGVVADPDVAVLRALGDRIRSLSERAVQGRLSFSSGRFHTPKEGETRWPGSRQHEVELDLHNGTGWWQPTSEDPEPKVLLRLAVPASVSGVVLKEEITKSQRIEGVEVRVDGITVAACKSVGYERLLEFSATSDATEVEVLVTASRGTPTIAGIAVLAAE